MTTSLEQIWRRGCRGEPLKTEESKKFAAMARSRFHTFLLGMDHANKADDSEAANALIRGLAKEIAESPGLRKMWLSMSVSDSDAGRGVSLQLERLDSPLH